MGFIPLLIAPFGTIKGCLKLFFHIDVQTHSVLSSLKASTCLCETSSVCMTSVFVGVWQTDSRPPHAAIGRECRGEKNWTEFKFSSFILHSFFTFCLCEQPSATKWISLRTDSPEVCAVVLICMNYCSSLLLLLCNNRLCSPLCHLQYE